MIKESDDFDMVGEILQNHNASNNALYNASNNALYDMSNGLAGLERGTSLNISNEIEGYQVPEFKEKTKIVENERKVADVSDTKRLSIASIDQGRQSSRSSTGQTKIPVSRFDLTETLRPTKSPVEYDIAHQLYEVSASPAASNVTYDLAHVIPNLVKSNVDKDFTYTNGSRFSKTSLTPDE